MLEPLLYEGYKKREGEVVPTSPGSCKPNSQTTFNHVVDVESSTAAGSEDPTDRNTSTQQIGAKTNTDDDRGPERSYPGIFPYFLELVRLHWLCFLGDRARLTRGTVFARGGGEVGMVTGRSIRAGVEPVIGSDCLSCRVVGRSRRDPKQQTSPR